MGVFNLSKLNNKHFLVLMQNGFTQVIGFGTSFLLFHYLSMEAVGMWYFVQSIVALCESARYGFLATATVTFYAGATPERAATVLGSVWFLALALSLLVLGLNAGALLFLPYTHNAELILCIKWVGITYLSSLPADVVFWRLQAEEKYGKMFWYRMVNSISSLIAFIVLILVHKMDLEHVFIWNFITNIFSSVVGILWNMSGIKYLFSRSKECVMELLHYGKYTLGTTSFSVLLGNMDTWIINFMLGPAALAVFNLAMRFMAIVEIPMRTFATTGMSEIAIAFNKDNRQRVSYIFQKYVGMITIGIIPIVIGGILLADIPINFLGGVKYHHSIAANAFRLFLLVSLCYPLDRFNGIALDVTRNTKINFYKMIIMLIVTVAADFAGVYLFGNIYGIAFSGLIVVLTAIAYGNSQLRKTLDYTIPGIFSMGYSEIKLLIRDNLGGKGK